MLSENNKKVNDSHIKSKPPNNQQTNGQYVYNCKQDLKAVLRMRVNQERPDPDPA